MGDARLDAIARGCRVQIIRMLAHAGSGHPGGSLSVIDLLVAIAFGRLRHDPRRPDWPERDRIVLSKGHAVPALYAVMAKAGYFSEASRRARCGRRRCRRPGSVIPITRSTTSP
jgi:transketolase